MYMQYRFKSVWNTIHQSYRVFDGNQMPIDEVVIKVSKRWRNIENFDSTGDGVSNVPKVWNLTLAVQTVLDRVTVVVMNLLQWDYPIITEHSYPENSLINFSDSNRCLVIKSVMEGCKELLKEKHAKYFARCLNVIPSSLESLDAIRYYIYLYL